MKVADCIAEQTRKNQVAILNALHLFGQNNVAALLGESASTVTRWKESDAERLAALLAAIGQQVVSVKAHFLEEEHLHALETLARAGLSPRLKKASRAEDV